MAEKYFRYALWLAWFTIAYNLAEGLLAVYFGYSNEALTLFGFGLDSFVEVISALGVLQMVQRIKAHPHSSRGVFERRALRITAGCFFALAAVLAASAGISLYAGHQPESTRAGLIISGLSLLIMWALIAAKTRVGKQLGSEAIVADARCNLVCLYMSLVLLVSSALYAWVGFAYADALGALALVYFSVQEGREALAKARGTLDCGC